MGQKVYKIQNVGKCGSDINELTYYEEAELIFLKTLDHTKDVIYWNVNDTVIDYLNPLTNETEQFIIDYHAIIKIGHETMKDCLYTIDSLPHKTVIIPEDKLEKLSSEKKMDYELDLIEERWKLNKYKATYEYCKERGMLFYLVNIDGVFNIKYESEKETIN